MENSDYILDLDSPTTPIKDITISNTSKTITANEIVGPGYKAILSYDDELKSVPFTADNSVSILSFGQVKPGESLLRSNTLTIIPGSAPGFQTIGYMDHALKSVHKSEIPNTSCDNGNCTNVLPDTWTLPLTYGYGYRCDNVSNDSCNMVLKDTYRRFSNAETNDTPVTILYSNDKLKSKVEFSHKINIPGSQKLTGYKNTLFFVTSPIL